MRKCDYCAQDIQDEAVYCRYCHHNLPRNEALAGKARCPFCAEWIDRGTVLCPYCQKDLTSGSVARRAGPADRVPGVPRPYDPRDVFLASLEPAAPPAEPGMRRPRPEAGKGQPAQGAGRPEETPPFVSGAEPSPRPSILSRLTSRDRAPGAPRAARGKKAEWAPQEPAEEGPLAARGGLYLEVPKPPPETGPVAKLPARPRRFTGTLALLVVLAAITGLAIIGIRYLNIDIAEMVASLGRPLRPALTLPSPTAGPTEARLSTPTQQAALVPEATPSPTAASTCTLWSDITLAQVGQTLCAYGVIGRRYTTNDIPYVVIFSEEPGTFIFIDRTITYTEFRPGMCVMATGTVEAMSRTRPVIDANGALTACP